MKKNYFTPFNLKNAFWISIFFIFIQSSTFAQVAGGDTPCTAGALGYTTSCSINNATNAGYTNSGVPAPSGCSNTMWYNGGDAWFTAQTGAGGDLMVEIYDDQTPGYTLGDAVFAVYTATGSCPSTLSLTLFDCDDDGGIGLQAAEYYTGLPASSTVYIRVFDYGGGGEGTFGICAYDPVPNPNYNCAGALPLPCPTTALAGTTKYTLRDTHGTPCSLSDVGVWYTFTGDGDFYTITLDPEDGYNMEMAVMSGSCGSYSSIACEDSSGAGGVETVSFVTGVGVDYYIYVADPFNSSGIANVGDFTISISCGPVIPPPNDACVDAEVLDCTTNNSVNGTTIFAVPNAYTYGCTMGSYGVWYSFVGTGDYFQLDLIPEAGYNIKMAILSTPTDCSALTQLACVNNSGSGGAEDYDFVTTPGTRYYVYVAHPTGVVTGRFTISLTCSPATPPANDDCSGAIDLVVNANCVTTTGTTQFASTSTAPAPGCGGTIGSDVWYTVTVPPSPGSEVTITTTAAEVTDSAIAVYTNTCGSLTLLDCDDNSGTGSMSTLTINNATHGVNNGDILYIRVWEVGNNNNGTFGICATASVSGTSGVSICQDSPTEPLQTDLFCNTGTSVPNPLNGRIDSTSPSAYTQPWYTVSTDPCAFSTTLFRRYDTIDFTVTADGTYVFTVNEANTGYYDTLGYIVVNDGNFVPGSCATGTFIAGDDISGPGLLSEITANLSAGVNYTLITTIGLYTSTDFDYQWDVSLTVTSAEWYTQDYPGGTPVGYGAYFDPIGDANVIAAGGAYANLVDTSTPGTYSFWVSCPFDTTRTQVDYVITPKPTATLSGSPGSACGTYDLTVTISDPTTATIWGVVITENGTPLTPIVTPSPPATLTVSTPAGTTYQLFNVVSNFGGSSCSWDLVGTVVVPPPSGITWNGTMSSDWFNANNWTPAGVPTSTDCVTIPDTGGGNDPEICGTCDANVDIITIENGGVLTILPNGTLTAQNEVTVDSGGTFELQGDQQDAAQLIQVNDVSNSGNITLIRETNVRSQDYAYWSSPVENYGLANFGPALIYSWTPTVGGNPGQHGVWTAASGNMVEGKGYAVRLTGTGNGDTAQWETITFNGVPHNGDVSLGINRGTYTGANIPQGGGQDPITSDDDNWNLVGNPYPSALNATTFLNYGPNSDLDGAVYLWTHGTSIFAGGANSPFYGTYVYNYNRNLDYLTYNSSGGTQSGFDGMIGSGQGFYVKMSESSSGTSSTVTFTNTMRSAANRNDQFFRSADSEIERHRIWLDMVTPSENVNRTLLAYVEGATLGIDRNFDAAVIGGNGQGIYSLIGDSHQIIQGRPTPFDTSDLVPLGIEIKETGQHAIAINALDGLFDTAGQDIFIDDLYLGIIHNLKDSPYFFNVNELGTYNNRFVLRYTNATLGIDDIAISNLVIMAPDNKYIKINSGSGNLIETVTVYDLLGRVLIDLSDINNTEIRIDELPKADGAYIVKVTLDSGRNKIQKVVLKQL